MSSDVERYVEQSTGKCLLGAGPENLHYNLIYSSKGLKYTPSLIIQYYYINYLIKYSYKEDESNLVLLNEYLITQGKNAY